MDVDLRALVPNLILFANYALVGYFTARTQLARRPLLDGWSLSGVAHERRSSRPARSRISSPDC